MKKLVICFLVGLNLAIGLQFYASASVRPDVSVRPTPPVPEPPKPKEEQAPNISLKVPEGQLKYEAVGTWLDRMHLEAPDQTELGVVGKDSEGRDIRYIKIGNTGPKVMIHAALHGNEKLGAMVSLGVMTTMLSDYMHKSEVTNLLRERQIYFVPVVCPEGYIGNSRHVQGLDPNRNWFDLSNGPKEKQSIPSVQALKDFHLEHKFKAVMSVHNYGVVYFHPWGYTTGKSPNDTDYKRILSKMSSHSGYDYEKLYRQSAPPYWGYEVDWYHMHGAFSIVNEIGRNFDAHPMEIKEEVEKNYPAWLIFIREGAEVESTP